MHRHSNVPTRIVGTHPRARPVGLTWADLGLDPDTLDWHADAACRSTDPDAFYPDKNDPHQHAVIAAAKRVCRGCPVRTQCRDYALNHREPHGIWGGLTAYERRQARRHTHPDQHEAA